MAYQSESELISHTPFSCEVVPHPDTVSYIFRRNRKVVAQFRLSLMHLADEEYEKIKQDINDFMQWKKPTITINSDDMYHSILCLTMDKESITIRNEFKKKTAQFTGRRIMIPFTESVCVMLCDLQRRLGI